MMTTEVDALVSDLLFWGFPIAVFFLAMHFAVRTEAKRYRNIANQERAMRMRMEQTIKTHNLIGAHGAEIYDFSRRPK